MPKTDGTPTKGEVTAEQLRQTKAELTRLAMQLELDREKHAENLAAASLAEQLRIAREEKKQERKKAKGQNLPAHRPSEYTEEAAESLLHWITNGKSLTRWCAQSGIPPMTVYRWMGQNATFRERYARAHEDRTDTLADEILDIADEAAGTDSIAAVQAARLRIDTRKWIAAKLKPQKWGEKQVVENTGTVTFSLGVPSRQPIDITPSPETRMVAGSPGGVLGRSADYESDSHPPASPSLALFSSRGEAEDAVEAPRTGPDATP